MKTQLFAWVLGVAFLALFAAVPYRRYTASPLLLYLFLLLGLGAVLLFGSGKSTYGANSWIRVGAFGLQPSEPAKVCFALCFGPFLSRQREQNVLNRPKKVLFICLLAAVPIGLVMLQNDTGTALVFGFMLLAMYVGAGLSYRYFAAFFGSVFPALPLLWLCLKPYQKSRILVFLHPEQDPFGAGYQVLQSKTAIGSGGLWGKGYQKGPMNLTGLIPEKDTDFVFSVIGEEWGLFGCVLVLGLLFVLLLRMLMLARQVKDSEGRLIILGLFAMMLFHTVENIGMCLGLLPVTGIPLPFFSYGGSSLVTCFWAAGILLNIDRCSRQQLF